jgi:hypothetical protein
MAKKRKQTARGDANRTAPAWPVAKECMLFGRRRKTSRSTRPEGSHDARPE